MNLRSQWAQFKKKCLQVFEHLQWWKKDEQAEVPVEEAEVLVEQAETSLPPIQTYEPVQQPGVFVPPIQTYEPVQQPGVLVPPIQTYEPVYQPEAFVPPSQTYEAVYQPEEFVPPLQIYGPVNQPEAFVPPVQLIQPAMHPVPPAGVPFIDFGDWRELVDKLPQQYMIPDPDMNGVIRPKMANHYRDLFSAQSIDPNLMVDPEVWQQIKDALPKDYKIR
ncbi:hypothetical protein ACE41H_23570 [Paenibacillus enshidis]|uniref:Spore coat protein n=1 Tax=Paenibacillus enshidis TaxID=1458439 RepID=A0ABV5AZS6_9BACL